MHVLDFTSPYFTIAIVKYTVILAILIATYVIIH